MSPITSRPLRIIVLGGGTAGWMAASLMAKHWGDRGIEISVLESPDIGIIGVGEGSTPQLKAFFDSLDIAESEWMPRCNATYKAGISFHQWSTHPGFASYFHPFPNEIDERTAPAFVFNSLARRRGHDVDGHPDRYFLATRLAQRKLAPLPAHSFPFKSWYGYHFDSALIGRFLREHSSARGVRHLEGTVARVEQTESGDIQALHTRDGRRIEGDFFVDSTGFRSLLLQTTLGVPFRSFADNLYNDSAVVAPTPADTDGISPQTTATALNAGWAWRIPLQSRVGNGYVYSSRYLDKDAAEAELRAHLKLDDSHPPLRHLSMKVGRVEQHWARNCLAVGLSQGFIEPLEATALHLVQATVENFIQAWGAGGFNNTHQDAFNANINARFEGVRDYIVCHYKVNTRRDSDYWRDNARNDVLSDSLRRILSCWVAGEDLSREVQHQQIDRYYAPASWHCLLGGYGVYPQRLGAPGTEVQRYDVARIDDFLDRCALNFRAHDEVLSDMGSAHL
jgi:2-polyprenyl-6-methoxyphenol hydroxylase-like FAD-dependent oxidoreductase